MLSNNRIGYGFTLLAAACVGGAGYAGALSFPDTPSILGHVTDNGQLAAAPKVAPRAPRNAQAVASNPVGASYALPSTPPESQVRDPDLPPDLASVDGPRGTSGQSQRYDTVGYATWYGEEMQGADTSSGQPFDPAGITAAHRTLPLGSIVEVTALDTGRTILALVNDRGPGRADLEIDLSRGAAQSLGVTGVAPVRIRLVTANSPDIMALRGGQAASRRIDAPQALLVALRRKLPARAGVAVTSNGPSDAKALLVSPPPPRDERSGQTAGTPAPKVPPTAGSKPASFASGAFVQVAALSHEGRAKALATMLHGRVHRVGTIFRVQMGPYANGALAKAARDDVARRGYGDARIVQTN